MDFVRYKFTNPNSSFIQVFGWMFHEFMDMFVELRKKGIKPSFVHFWSTKPWPKENQKRVTNFDVQP